MLAWKLTLMVRTNGTKLCCWKQRRVGERNANGKRGSERKEKILFEAMETGIEEYATVKLGLLRGQTRNKMKHLVPIFENKLC